MYPRPWLMVGLLLASALFLRTDSSVIAQETTVYLEGETLVPYQGLRDSGVTLTFPIDESTETVWISDPSRLKVGQIVETQDPPTREIMEVTYVGAAIMQVKRGELGTSPAPHAGGTLLYADFTQVKVLVSDVVYRPTGATLSEAVDAGTPESSSAFLAQSIGTTETTINVSDATLLTEATMARFDGTSFVSAENGGPDYPGGSFLASTGRVPMPYGTFEEGDSVTFGYASLPPGEPPGPDGPNGNGILAEVRLLAEREGPVPLALPDVKLTDIEGTPFFEDQGIGAAVTVVSEGAPAPPAPTVNCPGSSTQVCIEPYTQTVNVGDEFSVYVVAEAVTNLGAYEFTLGWTSATEEMTVQSVHRGYLKDDGSGWYRTKLSGGINDSATVIDVIDSSMLEVGWTVLVDNEEMLVLGVSEAPDTMTVIRGYNGTSPTTHADNAPVWAGPERMVVERAPLCAPHSGGIGFRADLGVLHVSDHSLLTASALQIDSEWFKVLENPARTLHDTGLILESGGVGETDLSLPVTGPGSVQKGWTLQVESELMVVTEDPGAGTVPVARGFFGSQASSHDGGTAIEAVFPEPNTVRVVRGFQGTPIQSHAADAPITDVDGLGDYAFTMALASPPSVDVDLVWADDGGFLGQSGRTVQCDPPSFGLDRISAQCDTDTAGPALPLGPTGSGTLGTVNVSGRELLDFTPSRTTELSSVTLHDISGDPLSASLGAGGTVKVVGCPDFTDDGVVDFVGDVIDVAKAALVPGWPQEEEHDVDLNGTIDFVGDVLVTAKIALASQPQPLRCPNPPPP